MSHCLRPHQIINPHFNPKTTLGAKNLRVWRVVKHFHYELLRKSFRLTLLNYLEKYIGKSFKKVKSYIYKHYYRRIKHKR